MATVTQAPAQRNATFRDVFAVGEYRALWTAQLLSIGGDQFARVALAVLVYGRTGSAALAAVTFAVTAVAMSAGGLLLGWTADRWPRRTVMIVCDVICTGLVLVMVVPGLPLAALIGLLFAVSLLVEPFLSSRQATNRAALGPDKFALGNSITLSTYQVAQLIGFAAGGVVAAAAGVRVALLIDAATFAGSAVIVRLGVKARPAADPAAAWARPQIWAGFRMMFTHPAARTAMLLMWCVAFVVAPEGVVAPLSRQLGGGTTGVGWLLAAMAAGATIGPLAYNRFVAPARRTRLAAVMAAAACGVLILFLLSPGLAGAAVILAVSGLFTGYIATAGASIFAVVPDRDRGKASGVIGAGMALGQGIAIVAAGVAAQHVTPEVTVACSGALGVVAAATLGITWGKIHRGSGGLGGRHRSETRRRGTPPRARYRLRRRHVPVRAPVLRREPAAGRRPGAGNTAAGVASPGSPRDPGVAVHRHPEPRHRRAPGPPAPAQGNPPPGNRPGRPRTDPGPRP